MSKFIPVAEPIYTHTLSKPFRYLDEELTEISIREPTCGDMMRIGNPVNYDPRSGEISFDDEKALKMLAALAGMSWSCLEKLPPADAVTLFWAYARFFLPA